MRLLTKGCSADGNGQEQQRDRARGSAGVIKKGLTKKKNNDIYEGSSASHPHYVHVRPPSRGKRQPITTREDKINETVETVPETVETISETLSFRSFEQPG